MTPPPAPAASAATPASVHAPRGEKFYRITELQRRLARPHPQPLSAKEAAALEALSRKYIAELDLLQRTTREERVARQLDSCARRADKDRLAAERCELLEDALSEKAARVAAKQRADRHEQRIAAFIRTKTWDRVALRAANTRYLDRTIRLDALAAREARRAAQVEGHLDDTHRRHTALAATSATLDRVDAARAKKGLRERQRERCTLAVIYGREDRIRARSPSPAAVASPPQTTPVLPPSTLNDDGGGTRAAAAMASGAPTTLVVSPGDAEWWAPGAHSYGGVPPPRPQSAPPSRRPGHGDGGGATPSGGAGISGSMYTASATPAAQPAGGGGLLASSGGDYISAIAASEMRKLALSGEERALTPAGRAAQLAATPCFNALNPAARRDLAEERGHDREAHLQRREDMQQLAAARRRREAYRKQILFDESQRTETKRQRSERRRVLAADKARHARSQQQLTAQGKDAAAAKARVGKRDVSRRAASDRRREAVLQAKLERQRVLDLAHLGVHIDDEDDASQ